MTTWNVPVPFKGTEEEKAVNRQTHNFYTAYTGETECVECCAKPWHTAADYPCGTEPPRADVEQNEGDPAPWVPFASTVAVF